MTGRMPFSQLRLESAAFTNPRSMTGLLPEEIGELALDIGRHGMRTPILVTSSGLVIAGQRRYRAVAWLIRWFADDWEKSTSEADTSRRLALVQQIGEHVAFLDKHGVTHEDTSAIMARAAEYRHAFPVTVIDDYNLTDTEIEGIALADNLQRSNLSSYEIALYLARLSNEGMSGVNIARLIGKSTPWVSAKLVAIRRAGPELTEAWRTGELSEAVVVTLSALPPAIQAKRIGAAPKPRGASNRPGVEAVKDALGKIEESTILACPVGSYGAGVRDALRWAAGRDTSAEFARLMQELDA